MVLAVGVPIFQFQKLGESVQQWIKLVLLWPPQQPLVLEGPCLSLFATCTGATSTAGGWWCRSSCSKGLTKELKTSLKDFSQLYLLCCQTHRFLKSALKNNCFFSMALWFVTASVPWSYLVCLSVKAQHPWTKKRNFWHKFHWIFFIQLAAAKIVDSYVIFIHL